MKVIKKLHCDNIWVKILTQASTQVSRLTVQKTNYVKKGPPCMSGPSSKGCSAPLWPVAKFRIAWKWSRFLWPAAKIDIAWKWGQDYDLWLNLVLHESGQKLPPLCQVCWSWSWWQGCQLGSGTSLYCSSQGRVKEKSDPISTSKVQKTHVLGNAHALIIQREQFSK